MRRLLPIALAAAVLVAAFAGVASARLAGNEQDAAPAAPKAAPLSAPAAAPAPDAQHPGAWGYRSSRAIAARLDRSAPEAPARSSAAGASATVTVTATVLPVVFVVFDESGDVARIVTNTPQRDPNAVLFLPRRGSESGAVVDLDATSWARARTALAAARAGTGTVWTA